MNQGQDERRGMPSASGGGGYAKCHGKWQLERGIPSTSSEAAEEGNRVHQWNFDEDSIKLTGEELELAKQCKAQREALLAEAMPGLDENPARIIKERRLWYRGNRFSGKADFIALRDGRGFLLDYKCGRIPVTPASENEQLRWYLALMDHCFKIDECFVAIVQPRCGAPTSHLYTKAEIKKHRNRVVGVLRKIEAPNPKLRPGPEQCRYCKAKAICPALEKKQEALATVNDVQQLTPVQLGSLLDILPVIEDRCKIIRTRAREMLKEDEGALPGWRLKPASIRRSIDRTTDAMKLLADADLLTPDAYLDACKVSLTKLQRAVAEENHLGPTDARKLVNQTLFDIIEEKQGEPSVERGE